MSELKAMRTRVQSYFGIKQVHGAEPKVNQMIEMLLSWMVGESVWQGSVKVSCQIPHPYGCCTFSGAAMASEASDCNVQCHIIAMTRVEEIMKVIFVQPMAFSDAVQIRSSVDEYFTRTQDCMRHAAEKDSRGGIDFHYSLSCSMVNEVDEKGVQEK